MLINAGSKGIGECGKVDISWEKGWKNSTYLYQTLRIEGGISICFFKIGTFPLSFPNAKWI